MGHEAPISTFPKRLTCSSSRQEINSTKASRRFQRIISRKMCQASSCANSAGARAAAWKFENENNTRRLDEGRADQAFRNRALAYLELHVRVFILCDMLTAGISAMHVWDQLH